MLLPAQYWITGLATAVVVVLCVLVHYEGLRLLSDKLPTLKRHHRRRIILLILALLFMHVVEVWIFGIAYFGLLQFDGYGELLGVVPVNLFDYIYYSASVYTTVGFGDIYPVGAIRTMTGTEGITGLTMITWSASYTFVEMLKSWQPDD
ncbi:MAG: potassium channel family protein [Woeseiaceae bacterium]|nr:potassium channel family protein [Woeseiaceae bacterium]